MKKSNRTTAKPDRSAAPEGWRGWDAYAPFYDWENARTLGRRDVPFWTSVARQARGPVLELGCGTGRITHALTEAGIDVVGIDRSAAMLAQGRHRAPVVRGDIRSLPFRPRSFAMVLAPYGILQSLTRPRDLSHALRSAAAVLVAGGRLGIDLVPDVPNWREYSNRIQLQGKQGTAHLTLVESVRQDRRRRLTTFAQTYIVRRGGGVRRHRFDLTFRTLTVPAMTRQLEGAGFRVESVLGDYRGRTWDPGADVWIILAKKG